MGVDFSDTITSLTQKLQSRGDRDGGEATGDKNKASNLNLITEINDSL